MQLYMSGLGAGADATVNVWFLGAGSDSTVYVWFLGAGADATVYVWFLGAGSDATVYVWFGGWSRCNGLCLVSGPITVCMETNSNNTVVRAPEMTATVFMRRFRFLLAQFNSLRKRDRTHILGFL